VSDFYNIAKAKHRKEKLDNKVTRQHWQWIIDYLHIMVTSTHEPYPWPPEEIEENGDENNSNENNNGENPAKEAAMDARLVLLAQENRRYRAVLATGWQSEEAQNFVFNLALSLEDVKSIIYSCRGDNPANV
jgi:hypothetical protein